MALSFANSISTRVLSGRFISITNGNCTFCFPPASILPENVMAWTARQACNPPLAETLLSTISTAESLAAGGGVSALAAKGIASESRMLGIRVCRYIDGSLCLLHLLILARRRKKKLLHHQSVYSKLSDLHTDAIAALHKTAFVGEHHPVRLSCFDGATLSQLPHFIHRRDNQLHMGALV